MDPVAIAFNVSAFVAGISLLQHGADNFTDSTIEIAKYLKVSDILVALLTAGAEWEELSIVVLCLVQNRPELAIGTIVGSCIANVLGAFSLALIVHKSGQSFNRSSKLYSVLLLLVNVLVTVLALLNVLNFHAGIALVVVFAVYVLLVSWGIHRGSLTAPRDVDPGREATLEENLSLFDEEREPANNTDEAVPPNPANETTPLVSQITQARSQISHLRSRIRNTIAPIQKLLGGLTALPISSFVLSHSSINLSSSLEIPDFIFGVTVLSFATNLPEKLANITDGSPGSVDFLIATIAGGNTFLLTLCIGIVLIWRSSSIEDLALPRAEAIWMCGTAVMLVGVVMVGRLYRIVGWLMMAAYMAFVVLEVYRFVDLSKFDFSNPSFNLTAEACPGYRYGDCRGISGLKVT